MNWFLGYSVEAPWPEDLPSGEIVPAESRHLTTTFYGSTKFEGTLVKPPFLIAPAGVIDGVLFLKHVVAYAPSFFEPLEIQLPHITVSRTPGHEKEWEKKFKPFPFYLKEYNLYHTVAHLQYEKVQSIALEPPFEEIPHTVDIAFKVKGRHVKDLYFHAALALSFRVPTLCKWIHGYIPNSLDEVVTSLNKLLYLLDIEEGSPMKAVSHAGFVEEKGQLLEWEMIVDV